MMITRIDEKCSKCLLCVRDCVSGIWRVIDGVPTPVEQDLCNRCSHCIAICPRGAIRHEGLDGRQAARVNRKNIRPEVYRDIIMGRRSIRHYRDREVPRDVIEKIIDLARYAPTASNDQNVGYIVITNKKILSEISKRIFGIANKFYELFDSGLGKIIKNSTGLKNFRYIRRMDYIREERAVSKRDYILYTAPVLILIHTPKKANFGCDNANIAATTIINYAHSLGLGTCFIGFMTLALRLSKKMRMMAGVPKDVKVHASLVMGYPAYGFMNTVSRKKADITWKE
ncbi:MAG TPA: nitroreductase family protein [Spirochaetota bacterium]|nr:nitroreductase family protein [Spirochaetota bacterium]HPC40672.1 nitroreductase family protein [Spirochaetota bacterium]HPL18276.1 nitroreductase family protein [Spirochaetota bacterium]HQF09420.1 nitroreductase family protein [Spirochaetota bacterium]HQH97966.1 nitroreductase family protein [Spirochaetota bacterium]